MRNDGQVFFIGCNLICFYNPRKRQKTRGFMIFSGGIERMRENNNGRSYGNNLFVPFSPIRRIVDEIMNGNQNNQYYFERLFFILR